MFAAKSAVPSIGDVLPIRFPVLEEAADKGITLITAPAGYVPAANLAAVLHERSRPVLWLRLDPDDGDPATFLLSLISAAQWLFPGLGQETIEYMQRKPGPIYGWPPLFSHLAWELSRNLSDSGALVLEGIDHLSGSWPTLGLFVLQILRGLPGSIACILVSSNRIPSGLMPPETASRGANELRIDNRVAKTVADTIHLGLVDELVYRAVDLVGGRPVLLHGLYGACETLGAAYVQHVLRRSRNTNELLARIAQSFLTIVDGDALKALSLAVEIGYVHPAFLEKVLGSGGLPIGPWFQPLADGWMRLHPVWSPSLRVALRKRVKLDPSTLRDAADYLVKQESVEQAVRLLFQSSYFSDASEMIAGYSRALMDRGQWDTLSDWLGRLPAEALHNQPWLLYRSGELYAARGEIGEAERSFAFAAEQFSSRQDSEGACLSLLAVSAVAMWREKWDYAGVCALAAGTIAESAGLSRFEGWVEWQLGCLAILRDRYEDAYSYFHRAGVAVEITEDHFISELFSRTMELVTDQRNKRSRLEYHREALAEAEREFDQAREQFQNYLGSLPENLGTTSGLSGWSQLPLTIKLAAPEQAENTSLSLKLGNLWSVFREKHGLQAKSQAPEFMPILITRQSLMEIRPPDRLGLPDREPDSPSAPGKKDENTPSGSNLRENPGPNAEVEQSSTGEPSQKGEASKIKLDAYLLGQFRLSINDYPIEQFPAGRSRTIFKYILLHCDQNIHREVLMDTFWPNAGPDTARNSLNVAIHSLRQTFQAVTRLPIILFKNGAYLLNTDIDLWLDIEDFEDHLKNGHQIEFEGQIDEAIKQYEIAASLYRGDFMADEPYEDWPVLTRERLRIAYLDLLDHLSQLYFHLGQYAACAQLCQVILARDLCREDAHCRLMRCYCKQDQPHLAIRQYQECVQALLNELDVSPSPATVQLYEQIRRREYI